MIQLTRNVYCIEIGLSYLEHKVVIVRRKGSSDLITKPNIHQDNNIIMVAYIIPAQLTRCKRSH